MADNSIFMPSKFLKSKKASSGEIYLLIMPSTLGVRAYIQTNTHRS